MDESTFAAAGLALGVRTNAPRVGETLRRILAPLLVADLTAPHNYSLRVAEDSGRLGRRFHELYSSHSLVHRSEALPEVARALAAHLQARWSAERGDLVILGGIAVSGPRGTALVPLPRPPGALLATAQRLCRRLGVWAHPCEVHALIPEDGLLVLPEPPAPPSSWDELGDPPGPRDGGGAVADPPWAAPGPRRVDHVLVRREPAEPGRAGALATMLSALRGTDRIGVEPAVTTLLGLLERTRSVAWSGGAGLSRAVAELIGP